MTDQSPSPPPEPAPPAPSGSSGLTSLPQRAIGSARDVADKTAHRTVDMIEQNPLSLLVGGLVVGVLAGAALPKGQAETKLLQPAGKRLTQGAALAAKAARDAGLSELAAAGISRDAARDQARKLVNSVIDAAITAGDAARRAAHTPPARPANDAPAAPPTGAAVAAANQSSDSADMPMDPKPKDLPA